MPKEKSAFDATARSEETPESLPRTPECPFCDGSETEVRDVAAHLPV